MDAVTGIHCIFFSINNLDDRTLENVEDFFTLVRNLFGGITGRNVHDKGRQLVAGKLCAMAL